MDEHLTELLIANLGSFKYRLFMQTLALHRHTILVLKDKGVLGKEDIHQLLKGARDDLLGGDEDERQQELKVGLIDALRDELLTQG